MGLRKGRLLAQGAVALALAVGGLGVVSQAAWATTYTVSTSGSDIATCGTSPDCATIAYALSLASAGDTISVLAGTYTQPLDVTLNNITITGATGTIIEPSSIVAATDPANTISGTPLTAALIYVAPGVTGFSLSGVTVNGSTVYGPSGASGYPACSSDYLGVEFASSSGSLNNVAVSNVQQPVADFGCQPGPNGDVYVASSPGGLGYAAASTAAVTITGVAATDYDKNGITCHGANTTCTITSSTVTGGGGVAGPLPLSHQAQNGIEIAYGASATITDSMVTDNQYNAQIDAAGCQTNWSCASASGILGYQAGSLTIGTNGGGNTLSYNDANVSDNYDSATTIEYNSLLHATDAANDAAAQGVALYADLAATIDDNLIKDNHNGVCDDAGTAGIFIDTNHFMGATHAKRIYRTVAPAPPVGNLPLGANTPVAVVGCG